MNPLAKNFRLALWLLVPASFWDGGTTVYGTIATLNKGTSLPALFAASICAIIVLVFMYATFDIFNAAYNSMIIKVLKVVWVICLSYNIYTSFLGNWNFLVGGDLDITKFLVIVGMTLIVSGSTIFASWILYETRVPSPSS
jgi:hypothetical protein